MLSREQFEQSAAAIPYQYPHPLILAAIVRWLKPQTCVEIGSHIGMTAVHLARALQENGSGRLFCIDSFCWINETQEEQWEANLTTCGVREVVRFVKGRSQEVTWPEHIDFAFVDANHTYGAAKHDIEKARSLGATVIAMHDTVSWEGSRKYAEEMRESKDWKGWDFLEENSEGGLMIVKRREPKVDSWGVDVGELWDRSVEEVERRRREKSTV